MPRHIWLYIYNSFLKLLLMSFIVAACGNGQQGGVDLVFVLDESGSIGSSGFELLRQFTIEISRSLDIDLQRSLVGVILFGNDATVEFGVTQNTNEASLLSAINNLQYGGGSTNTAAALDLLRTAGQPGGELNLRSGFTHIAIVVTDGASNDETATLTAASALRQSNVYDQVYAVGVSGADDTELNAIASDLSLVFFTNNFDSNAIAMLQQGVTQQLMPCVGKLCTLRIDTII